MLAMRALRRGAAEAAAARIAQTCVPPPAIDQPAAKLSQTGCMDPVRPDEDGGERDPVRGQQPALVRRRRQAARPGAARRAAKIHVKNCATTPAECPQGAADDGKWVLPVGTVMVKSFLFDGKLVETRLFVHFDAATWVGYSYEWNEAQTDATIVADERVEVAFNTGQRTVTWHLPSRMDCMTCHTPDRRLDAGARDRADEPRRRRDEPDRSLRRRWGFSTPRRATPYKAALPDPRNVPGARRRQRAPFVPARQLRLLPPPRRPELRRASTCATTSRSRTRTPAAPTPERGNQGVPDVAHHHAGSAVAVRPRAAHAGAARRRGREARTDAEDRELRRRHDGGVADSTAGSRR